LTTAIESRSESITAGIRSSPFWPGGSRRGIGVGYYDNDIDVQRLNRTRNNGPFCG